MLDPERMPPPASNPAFDDFGVQRNGQKIIVESRMALGAISSEMDFVWKVSQRYAGKDLPEAAGGPFTWLGKKIG